MEFLHDGSFAIVYWPKSKFHTKNNTLVTLIWEKHRYWENYPKLKSVTHSRKNFHAVKILFILLDFVISKLHVWISLLLTMSRCREVKLSFMSRISFVFLKTLDGYPDAEHSTVMIRLSRHVSSWSIFPDLWVFMIIELPISPNVEIDSHTFCPDKRDFRTIGTRINESLL